MKINVKYFGMIAEAAGKNEELISVSEGVSVSELKKRQTEKYNIADQDSVQVAVNQNLDSDVKLKDGDEVAFLPPFAGG